MTILTNIILQNSDVPVDKNSAITVLLKSFHYRKYWAGEDIIDPHSVAIIMEGDAAILIPITGRKNRNLRVGGDDYHTAGVLRAEDWIGETELFLASMSTQNFRIFETTRGPLLQSKTLPNHCLIQAGQSGCLVKKIRIKTLLSLLQSHCNTVAIDLLILIGASQARKLRHMNKWAALLAYEDTKKQLLEVLIELASMHSSMSSQEGIVLRLSREYLGHMINITREQVGITLVELNAQGKIIAKKGVREIIVRWKTLEEYGWTRRHG